LNVSNTTPATYTLSVTSPAANATVKGTIAIAGQAPGFLNVEISNSSGTLLARTTPNTAGAYTATVDTTRLPNGTDTLTINAWNSPAGQPFTHTAQATLPLNVSNTTPPTSTLPPPISGTNYQLVFDDEFNGTSIDASKWSQVGPWGVPVASHWSGHFTYPSFSGNFSNVSEANGLATITIHNTGGGPGGTWTGGVLSTAKYFTYGFFEARVKLPAAGNGIWPAFWLVGGNGEIDTMEFFGYDAKTIPQTLMPQHQVRSSNADWTQDYHLFQALWTPTRVTFYIDNVQTGSFASPAVTIPAQPMTMILNFDVGPWAGSNPPSYLYPNSSTPTTAQFNIDYARVYQLPAASSAVPAVSSQSLVSNATAAMPEVSTTANTSSAASTSTRGAAQVIQQPAPSPIARLKWATQMKPRLAQTDGSTVV